MPTSQAHPRRTARASSPPAHALSRGPPAVLIYSGCGCPGNCQALAAPPGGALSGGCPGAAVCSDRGCAPTTSASSPPHLNAGAQHPLQHRAHWIAPGKLALRPARSQLRQAASSETALLTSCLHRQRVRSAGKASPSSSSHGRCTRTWHDRKPTGCSRGDPHLK